ncbi:MAG TPA: carboxypeptidase-like regulatory domain-containing protein [Pyrinomonadaceae bacterium]|nr:carboxypeptidase-like regulatory domain-containing protein [Pyrinomonadaceae bacterium]
MRKLGLIFASIFLLSAAAFAQTGVKGKVRDPNGNGIAKATIDARQEGQTVRTTTSDSKGNFAINLAPGLYNIGFEANGYSLGVLYKIEVKNGKMRDLGDRLILSRDRGSLVLVRGIVFDKDQFSIGGAKVELYIVNDDGSEKKVTTVFTNISGDFAFRGIDVVKKVRVKASFRGFNASKDIDVDQPEVYRTAIVLDYQRERPN